MKYKAKENFVYGKNQEVKKGELVELSGEEEKAVLAAGLIEKVGAVEKSEEPEPEQKEEKESKKKGK